MGFRQLFLPVIPLRELGRLTWVEVRELLRRGVDTVILPVGTVEPHGPHLPLGTDAIIPEVIARELAERIDALVMPTIYYGVTRGLHGYPGSVRVEPDTLERLVYETLSSMAMHGFKYAIILNGHGGREQVKALERAAYKLWVERGMAVAIVDWWTLARERGVTEKVLGKEGGHAGTDETAMVYAANPSLVKEKLYDSGEIVVHTGGLRSFPLPGTIINYSPEEGDVKFDPEAFEKYFEEVVATVEEEVKAFLYRARKLLGDD